MRPLHQAPPAAARAGLRAQVRRAVLALALLSPSAVLVPAVLGPAVLGPAVLAPAVLVPAVLVPAVLAPARAQDAPQPELRKEPLVIVTRDGKAHRFSVEMALEPKQQEVGLMFRPAVPPDGGMLFDWGSERTSIMWMKNTIASLDMLFIRQDGTIRSIAERTVPGSLAAIDSHGAVRATLELAAGTAERLNIRVGDTVRQRIFGNPP